MKIKLDLDRKVIIVDDVPIALETLQTFANPDESKLYRIARRGDVVTVFQACGDEADDLLTALAVDRSAAICEATNGKKCWHSDNCHTADAYWIRALLTDKQFQVLRQYKDFEVKLGQAAD